MELLASLMTNWEHVKVYPEMITDAIMYVAVAVVLILISWIIGTIKEQRRLKKEYEAYQLRRKDEEQGEP